MKKYILNIAGVGMTMMAILVWAANPSVLSSRYYPFKEPEDTSKPKRSRQPTYVPQDRPGDPFGNPPSRSPIQLQDPPGVQNSISLDSSGQNFEINENIGGVEYRPPSAITWDEYVKMRQQEMIRNYWQNKGAGDTTHTPNKDYKPFVLAPIKGDPNAVEIRPTGFVNLDFGGKFQRVKNPTLPIRQQHTGMFVFDQQINMNVVGRIADRLKLTVNWDTKATFEFQNNIKVEFTGKDEDIIKKIDVGVVNFPLPTTLISGSQNLFGVKAKMQFGRMTVTSVIASQRGKTEEMTLQGGAQAKTFEVRSSSYEEYKHFFVSHFNRAIFEPAMKSLPLINSQVQIRRIEVYVTNRTSTTAGLRSMVAYTDLGESNEFLLRSQWAIPGNDGKPAANTTNTLYSTLSTATYLDPNTLPTMLDGQGLIRGTDYEIVKSARKLGPNDYIFNAELGYISLNTEIKRDEVLAVAYEYSYKGETFKVGELTEDYQGRNDSSVAILKLLKPSSVKTRLPTWDLMMKNIYNLGSTQLQRDMFQLRIIYRDDISGADLPNLQEGIQTKDVPLLQIMGLDRLNPNNDPSPDGNFDFIEGTTINTQNGRVIFPVLEPFGSHLESKFNASTEANLIRKYSFFELYDSTKSDAQQIAAKDKFFLKGRYQSGSGSEIVLPGINIAPGSVTVTAGSTVLREGVDYTIDYSMGRLKIINDGILASGQEIKVRFEKQDLFNFRRKNFYGTRLDFRVNKDFNIGGTIIHQNESPNFTRVNIGDEPSSNTMLGADMQFKKDSRFTTRMIDKLPLLSTKAMSNYTFSGEYAALIPGYNKIIDRNDPDAKGTAYIDDFEAVKTPYDFARTPSKWKISTTPQRFAESSSTTQNTYYRRANVTWYNIDNTFYRTNSGLPSYLSPDSITNHFVRQVLPQEIFPNLQRQQVQTNQIIFDMAYYPSERGPYNYNPAIGSNNGLLPNPANNWGGMMREIRTDIDFDNANIQYIEFWLMSPYITSTKGNADIEGAPFDLNNKGKLYFNLGSISEDVMKNERQDFENGLPEDGSGSNTVTTTWGVTTTQQFITAAFSSNTNARPNQDIGLDGLNNEGELAFFTAFVNAVQVSPLSAQQKSAILADPSNDDFGYFLGGYLDDSRADILTRYKKFYGMENNSPINTGNGITPSSTTLPDNEDLNQNNTIDALDEYYEYEVDIDPTQFAVGQNYIVGQQSNQINGETVTWYQFRIPIRMPDNVVGAISGFKTIKFMRMYVTGFAKPVVLRFGQLQLVSSQWRVYQPDDINTTGTSVAGEPDDAVIDVSTVNIEENGQGSPTSTPYVLPPGFIRDQDVTTTINRQINEQSLRVCVSNLDDGNARAAYKNVTMDMMNYGRIKAFIHAETADETLLDGNATAFVRIGTDPTQNYYEIEVPLHFTRPLSTSDPYKVWPEENWIDVQITDLTGVKIARNNQHVNVTAPYTMTVNGKKITVVGNPDLSTVMVLMLGLRNPRDDNQPRSFCVWMDEFRLADFNSQAGQAVTGNLNMRLADFANINATARYTGIGFGSIDQKISQRQRNQTLDWGLSGNIALDKFLPTKWGLKLPLYMGINRKIIAPQYDPLNPDVRLSTTLDSLGSDRTAYKRLVTDQTTQKSINFTNIQKVKTNPSAKAHLYDVSNLTLSVGYQETHKSSAILHKYLYQYYTSALGYTFTGGAKSYEPFKKSKWLDKKSLKLIKDFNIGYMPTSLTAQFKIDRRLTRTEWYESDPLSRVQDPLFEKSYTMNRNFGFVYAFSKNLTFDFKANAYAVIDEPIGEPGSQHYKDSVRSNLLKGGRLKNADQMLGMSYKVPLDKTPILDWIQTDLRYTAGYTWTASALGIQDTMGNTISNTSERTINGRLSMDKLYNKSKFLKQVNAPPLPKGQKPPTPAPTPPPVKPKLQHTLPDSNMSTPKDTMKYNKAQEKDTSRFEKAMHRYSKDSADYQEQKKDTIPPPENKALKFALRTVMMLKNLNIMYSMNTGTSLPGYMRTPTFMGMSSFGDFGDGWVPFILGSQNPDIRHTAANNGWLSQSRYLNTPFTQTKVYTLTGKATLEPFRELRIQVDMKTTWTNNYSELYRMDSTGGTGWYVSNNPSRNGNFSVSYITILTAFKPEATFNMFLANLEAMKQQLGSAYDIKSQQVMIPSFLAAYSGSAVNTVKPVSLPKIPLPNWRIDYTGLGKIPAVKARFQSVTISHAYTSLYGIGTFTSSLLYGPGAIQPGGSIYNINNVPSSGVVIGPTGLPVPTYVMDGATIRETFAPLIGVNARSKGNASYKIEWTKNRNIGLQLNNGQITEDLSNGIVLGYGYTKRNMPIPKMFTRGQKGRTFKGDITARLDFTVRDTRIVQRRLDHTVTTTAGNINFQFKPTVTYAFNARVSAMFYFERSVNTPRISSSYKRSATNFGVQIRFSLS